MKNVHHWKILMTEICKETDNVTNGSFPDMTPIDNK